jgi:hypothetical protein
MALRATRAALVNFFGNGASRKESGKLSVYDLALGDEFLRAFDLVI